MTKLAEAANAIWVAMSMRAAEPDGGLARITASIAQDAWSMRRCGSSAAPARCER